MFDKILSFKFSIPEFESFSMISSEIDWLTRFVRGDIRRFQTIARHEEVECRGSNPKFNFLLWFSNITPKQLIPIRQKGTVV